MHQDLSPTYKKYMTIYSNIGRGVAPYTQKCSCVHVENHANPHPQISSCLRGCSYFFQILKFVYDYDQVKYDSVRSLLFFLNICKSQSLRYGIFNQWKFFTTISRYYKVFMLFVFVFLQFSVKRNSAHNMTFAYIMCKNMT